MRVSFNLQNLVAAGLLCLGVAACSGDKPAVTTLTETPPGPAVAEDNYVQNAADLMAGEVMAVAYSGFREGQHPDRGDGAVNPSVAEISEDLDILVAHGFKLIRLYDSGANTQTVLKLIRERELPLKVLLGMWLEAEISNHEGCAWLHEPIPPAELAANTVANLAEVKRGIEMARNYPEIIVAINVGNEALVDWNDHMVSVDSMVRYLRLTRQSVEQPVSTADNYEWWIRDGASLLDEVDFLGVHTYPVWEGRSIEDGLAYTIENIERVHAALPGQPIVILEAGWATTAIEFGDRAGEKQQQRYYEELGGWARATNTTVFFFEAFDEPWKGDPAQELGAEKHWGLFRVDRSPKQVMQAGQER